MIEKNIILDFFLAAHLYGSISTTPATLMNSHQKTNVISDTYSVYKTTHLKNLELSKI